MDKKKVREALQSALANSVENQWDDCALAAQRVECATASDMEVYIRNLVWVISDHGSHCVECGVRMLGLESAPTCPSCLDAMEDAEDEDYGCPSPL